MSNDLLPFTYEDHLVRVLTIAAVCAAGALTLTAGLAWVCWQLNQADTDEWGVGR